MRRVYVTPGEVLQLKGIKPSGKCLLWIILSGIFFFLPVFVPFSSEFLVWRASEPFDFIAFIFSFFTWGAPEHIEVGPFFVSMIAMWFACPLVTRYAHPAILLRYLLYTVGLAWLLQVLLFWTLGDVFFVAHYIPLAIVYFAASFYRGMYISWGNYAFGKTDYLRIFLWIGIVISFIITLVNGRSILPSLGSLLILFMARRHFWPRNWLGPFTKFFKVRPKNWKVWKGKGRRF